LLLYHKFISTACNASALGMRSLLLACAQKRLVIWWVAHVHGVVPV